MNPRLFGVISIYGLLIACAMALSVFLCSKQEKRLGLPKDLTYDLALWVIPAGVIGARIFYVVQFWEQFRGRGLLAILNVHEGGLVFYGGFILAPGCDLAPTIPLENLQAMAKAAREG